MTNREVAKQVLEKVFGLEIETRFINSLKGCDYIKNTECNNYQDCENCKLYHFWYNEYTGKPLAKDKTEEQMLTIYKEKLRGIIAEECNKRNENGDYVYDIECEKVFGKLMEIIYQTDLD